MNRRLFLIDGHALVFKMYYAFLRRPMINSKGEDTSILFGFTKYILELIEKEKPTHFAVAFDPPGGTFRNELYPEYKANRQATPQLVIDALEPLVKICRALRIPVLMVPGYEADDVIGSMSVRAEKEGFSVVMVTPDKDYGQLITPNVVQFKPGKGGADSEIVDAAAVCARYGIDSPLQVIDMLTICGDTADNVPGVKGVGEVGAGKLISQFKSVENIYEHLDELTPRQAQLFRDAQDHIALSRTLVTIKTDVPLDVKTEDMALDGSFEPEISELFSFYEFGSLRRYIASAPRRSVESRPVSGDSADAPAAASAPAFGYEEASPADVVRAAAADGKCSFAVSGGKCGVAVLRSGILLAAEAPVRDFAGMLSSSDIEKYGCDIKPRIAVLEESGITLGGRLRDVSLMDYLLNPERSHKLDFLSRGLLGVELETAPEAAPAASLFDEIPEDDASVSLAREAAVTLAVGSKLDGLLEAAGMTRLYETMEEPLIRVLSSMEREGVKVDIGSLREFADGLRREVETRQATIREMTGEPTLNALSPKQLGIVLFEKMRLDPKVKVNEKHSYSTDEETLTALYDTHPVIEEILEFRAAKKLLSTYIEPFQDFISPRTGKVHTTFNQALTATGRLSSSKPNLQNIPIRTERGKEIRRAFVPSRPDGFIVSADYSQIELRIMAHLCQDAHMIEAFRGGDDVHKATAAKIFGISPDEVTPEQRRIAKTANFGIMYGISAFGLSQRLHISRSEAKKVIEDYFAGFPSIRSFIDDTLAGARENAYVETLFGRRRYVPDVNSHNGTVRALAERNAVNAPIQGTAADIIKLAMIAVDRRLRAEGLRSRMVLQIHDELLFDAAPDEVETLQRIVKEEMENVVELSIPLTVECNYGKNWLEAH